MTEAVTTEATTTPGTTPGAAPNPATPAPAAPEGQPSIGNSPAPAAPVVEEASVASFEPTGNAGLDYALAFVGKLGFGGNHEAIKAAEAGDFGILKAELAKLGAKAQGWEQIVALGEDGLKAIQSANKAQGEKNAADIHAVVGGKEQWDAISKWAGENADPAEKVAVNQALALGGFVAKAVAARLAEQYGKASGVTAPPANVTTSRGAAPASEKFGPREYVAAVNALKPAERVDGNPKYEELKRRASASVRYG